MADSLLFGESQCHFRLPVGETPIIMQPASDCRIRSEIIWQQIIKAFHQRAVTRLVHQGGLNPQTLCVGASVRVGDTRFALSHHFTTGQRF